MHQQQELDGVTYKVSDEEGKYALHFLLLFFRNISRVAIYLLWLFLLLFFRNITRVAIYLLWLRLLLLVFFIIVVDLKVSWMLLIQWQLILETTAFLEYIKSNVKTNIRFHGSLILWMFNNIDIMAITFAIAHTIKRYLSVLLHHN